MFTHATNEKDVSLMKQCIENNFQNIPFITTLARDEKRKISHGLDKLIKSTIEHCKMVNQGGIFNGIKKKLKEEIINVFNIKNLNTKKNINNEIISNFINNFNKVQLKKEDFKKYIFDLFSILFLGYLKLNNAPKIEKKLSNESFNSFFNGNLERYLDNYVEYYTSITKSYIDKIKEEKAINYLDIQARMEIKYNNIEISNKCTKLDFINIIEKFLKHNFYYIAQKCFVCTLLEDFCEQFSENIEKEVNNIIVKILNNEKNLFHWYEDIYKEKIEDLNKTIQNFYRNKGYNYDYDHNEFKNNNIEEQSNESNYDISYRIKEDNT